MIGLGPIAFAAPWLLAGAAVLPAIWWLLRVVPPAPRRQSFPPLRLLKGLGSHEEATARTPWWLLVLRLLAAALVLLGLARPVINPDPATATADRALLVVIDDGWAAAADWNARRDAALALIDGAGRAGRAVRVLATAPEADGSPPRTTPPGTAEDARQIVLPLLPKPWPSDPDAAAATLAEDDSAGTVEAVWLSDLRDRPGARRLADLLQRRGGLTVMAPTPGRGPLVLLPPRRTADGLSVVVRRPAASDPAVLPARAATLRALDERGRPVAAVPVAFAAGQAEVTVALPLPPDLRESLARLEVGAAGGDPAGAAAVTLLDDRWRRHPAGIVSPGDAGGVPLLDPGYYLEKALAEAADVRRGPLGTLLDQSLSVLFAPDGTLPEPPPRRLADWVAAGGVLVRFAGPRLAEAKSDARRQDDLLPTALRGGGRTLGGVLSWSEPAGLAPFPAGSPFAGLTVPPDVRVRAQVLAEPSADLSRRTWARLRDGTPLVTGAAKGRGWTVLIHTTANAAWTDLPLSGLFPLMLDRLGGLGQGLGQGAAAAEDAGRPLPPRDTLDGLGRLGAPPPTARPLPAGAIEEHRAAALIGPAHPPGLYGADGRRRPLNLTDHPGVAQPRRLDSLPPGVRLRGLDATASEIDLRPWLLSAAFALLLADALVAFVLRGILSPWPRRRRSRMTRRSGAAAVAVAGLAVLATLGAARAAAAPAEDRAVDASLHTRLAYVRTGIAEVDHLSERGLGALTDVLARRSSAELARPMALDIDRDDLTFHPLIYWPAAAGQTLPGPAARDKVARYLDGGGLILFDGASAGAADLRALLDRLDIPPLVALPGDHVLNRSFYLLNGLAGRVDGGPVWIARDAAAMASVSPVIIGSNDWAGAWARDAQDRPLLPVVTGGEAGREMAYRAGVNMVLYALTGNYKADQVHLPAILERLTQ
jgi:hypothetical protein